MQKKIDNNFKYLTQIVEEYKANPTEYRICRKKRLLLLKNFNEIFEDFLLQCLLEGFIRDKLHFITVKDIFGVSVFERGGSVVLDWAYKYHDSKDVDLVISEIFDSEEPPVDPEVEVYYKKKSLEFKEKMKKINECVVVVNTEFKRINLYESPPQNYARIALWTRSSSSESLGFGEQEEEE